MTDPLRLLLDATSRLFEGVCTTETLEAAEAGEWPADAWAAVAENGLPLALLPETSGGAELTLPQGVALLREAGRQAVPLPLGETMLATHLLHRSGLALPAGPVTPGPLAPRDRLRLRRSAHGASSLDATVHRLPWARAAHVLLVVEDVEGGDGSHIVLLPPDEGRLERGTNMAGEPRDDLVFDGVPVPPERLAPSPISAVELRRLAALFRLALMAGAEERVLALTLEHAGERVQFGRPIGRFQAIQQHLAVLAGETAAVVAATEAAAQAMGTPEAPLAIASAKARAGESVRTVAAISHQVHGAIGFTREHVLHHFTRRLWAWRDEAGSESDWWDELGAQALAAGRDGLWPLLTGP